MYIPISNFYGKFFEIDPAVKRLFHEKSMPYQARALMQMVTMLMKCIDRLDSLTPHLEKLGKLTTSSNPFINIISGVITRAVQFTVRQFTFSYDTKLKILWTKLTFSEARSKFVQSWHIVVCDINRFTTGVSHLIYGVEVKDFQSWAISLVTTFEAVLGKEAFGKTEKDAWMSMIAGVSSIIINSYDAARAGKSGFCEVSFGGKTFKKYWCALNHEKLSIYRDKKVSSIQHFDFGSDPDL